MPWKKLPEDFESIHIFMPASTLMILAEVCGEVFWVGVLSLTTWKVWLRSFPNHLRFFHPSLARRDTGW
jgi:hypothetical protein